MANTHIEIIIDPRGDEIVRSNVVVRLVLPATLTRRHAVKVEDTTPGWEELGSGDDGGWSSGAPAAGPVGR